MHEALASYEAVKARLHELDTHLVVSAGAINAEPAFPRNPAEHSHVHSIDGMVRLGPITPETNLVQETAKYKRMHEKQL